MLIFGILGICFFPKIIAEDEIKIYQNKSIHWKRHCDERSEDKPNICLTKRGNTEMKYLIDSPDKSEVGKLVKDTKIEGCQNIGECTLILQLGMVSK